MPPQPAPARARRLNVRSAVVLALVAALGLASAVGAWYWQKTWGKSTLVAQARVLAEARKDDLALSFLNRYLLAAPQDLEALALKGEILARSAQTGAHLDEVIRLSETLLRLEGTPRGEEAIRRSRETRRRLVEAYLRHGTMVDLTQNKYASAEALAKELAAETQAPEDLRLHARTLERLGAVGGPGRYAEAAAEFERARDLDPKDVAGAELAARLHFFALKDPQKGEAALRALTRDNPSVPAFLAAARVRGDVAAELAGVGSYAEADAQRAEVKALLDRAVAAGPHDLQVRLAAADLALAARRPAEAAAHLAEVAEADRKDYRYRTLRGIVDLFENKTADAIENWRSGLIATEGSDAELAWRLAYVLLQLGRIDEATPLISQFRRAYGGEEPPAAARYLEALRLLKLNRPVEAAAELEKARATVPEGLKAQYFYTLGQAHEAIRNDALAMEDYAVAIAADPRLAAPRLARARLLQAGRPEDAYEALRRGLAEAGEDPALIAALARLELQKQRRLAPNRRDWGPLEALLERGRKAAPSMPELAVVRSEAMAAQGKVQEAADMLKTATAIDPSDPELWAARAERLVALGKLDEALLVLDQGAEPKAAGDQARLRILRAKILTLKGHGREARDGLVRDQERVRPDQRPMLWMALGELYTAQGDARSARKAFSEWAKLLPDDPLPRLFVLEMALSDPEAESEPLIEETRRALTEKIGGFFGRVGEATYLLRDRTGGKEDPAARTSRLARAEALIAKIEAESPQLRYGPLLRGMLAEQRGEPAKAAEAYERAVKADGGTVVLPRLVRLYGELKRDDDLKRLRETYASAAPGLARMEAELYARQGDEGRAEALARQVVDGDAESLDARVWQARVLNSLGKPEEAEKALRDLVEKSPETLGPWLALIYFQVSVNQKDQAVRTVEEMIQKVKNVERPELVWAQAWRVVGEAGRADKAFEAALARWPDDPRVTRAAAQYYESTGRPKVAQETLRGVLERDPSQRWAQRGLALLMSARTGDPAAWRSAWEMVKDPAPSGDLPEDRLIRALVLARGPEAGNRDEAVKMLERLVDDLPADLPASKTSRDILAKLLLRTDPARAAEFAALDAQAPNAAPAALSLHAEALLGAKKLDAADRQIGRLAAVAPGDPATVTLLARLQRARGQGVQAAEALERSAPAKIAGPDGERAGRLIVQTLLMELEQPAAAERVARLLLEKFPQTGGVLAAVVAHQGRRDEALKLYLDAIKVGDPANIREAAQNTLALITKNNYDPDTIQLAEDVIDAARKKAPDNSELLAMAGYLRHYQGRYEEEIKIYGDALADRPEDFTLMNNMAWTVSEGLKKPEQALEQINNAIEKSVIVPPQFYDTRGVIYTRLGRLDDAIHDLEMAVLDRPTGLVWAHLARAYQKAGKMDKYHEAREKARKATPPLTPDSIEVSERDELVPLIFGDLQ